MINEIQLFVDDIKPALLITKKNYEKNIEVLKNYNYIKEFKSGYLISKEDVDIENKLLGDILGYPPMCVRTFEKKRIEPKKEKMTSYFLNYGGINFNCFNYYKEALEWCNNQYKDKMLKKYGKIEVTLKEIEFKKNYLEGYIGRVKKTKKFEILD